MADGRDIAVWDNHADECREENRKPFEFQDEDTESSGGWMRQKVLAAIKEGAKSALDVGCGPGYWRNLFAGMDYTGFDQSAKMLELAQELTPPGTWKQGNGRELTNSFSVGTFDIIFTSSVLQHNRHVPDKTEVVQGIHALLKPNGYFLCTENTFRADNKPESVGNPGCTDGYSFTPEGWEKYMGGLGFELLGFNGKSEYFFKRKA